MFTKKDLASLDREYFKVIFAGCYSVTLQSKNTGHCWQIYHEEIGTLRHCIIWHTHGGPYTTYHEHGHGRNLASCISQIKNHDTYQLKKDARKLRTARDKRYYSRIDAADTYNF